MAVEKLVNSFILWAIRRAPKRGRITTHAGEFLLSRFAFLWPDEYFSREDGKHYNRPPWWRPFNMFVHCWRPKKYGEEFHSHARWTITLCLRGKLLEQTPHGHDTYLTPGSIVVRSRNAMHAVSIPQDHHGKTWTLFICGRRKGKKKAFRREA
jgi:hypothetical protein